MAERVEIDWDAVEAAVKERQRIEDTHSWMHRCFPPGPTTCILCHANMSDPELQECLSAGVKLR